MDLFQQMRALVQQAILDLVAADALPGGLSTDAVRVEPARDPLHGEMATNAALVLAKGAGLRPRDVALALTERLMRDDRLASATVAGPGFVNLRLVPSVWQAVPAWILQSGGAWPEHPEGRAGQGGPVSIACLCAEAQGALSLDEARAAVLAEATARMLRHGGIEASAVFLRAKDPGQPFDALAPAEPLALLTSSDLVTSPEAESAAQALRAEGLIDRGALDARPHKRPEDWQPAAQTLLRTSDFGDETDRVLARADGSATAFAAELAAAALRLSQPCAELIDIIPASLGSQAARLAASARVLGSLEPNAPEPRHHLTQLQPLTLMRDSVPLPPGDQTVSELIAGLGSDIARFALLARRPDGALELELRAATEQSRANPVFNVQYAHARAARVLRLAQTQGVDTSDAALALADLGDLHAEAQLALLRKLAEWPRIAEIALRLRAPHRLAAWLDDLAGVFDRLWSAGAADPGLSLLSESDLHAQQGKIALARAVMVVISVGLGIFGVTPAEEMR